MPRFSTNLVNLSGMRGLGGCVVGGDGDYGDGYDVDGNACDTVLKLPIDPVVIATNPDKTDPATGTLDLSRYFNLFGFTGDKAMTPANPNANKPFTTTTGTNMTTVVLIGAAALIVVAMMRRNG